MINQRRLKMAIYALLTVILHFSNCCYLILISEIKIDAVKSWANLYGVAVGTVHSMFGGGEDILAVTIFMFSVLLIDFCLMIRLTIELKNNKINALFGKALVVINAFSIISPCITYFISDMF